MCVLLVAMVTAGACAACIYSGWNTSRQRKQPVPSLPSPAAAEFAEVTRPSRYCGTHPK
jgi:flagellar basal body-associated protein FliL